MTVKQLINKLKECNPESEISINGLMLLDVFTKPGYWDGYYMKLNSNNDLIFSIENEKVILYSIDLYDWVESLVEQDLTLTEILNKVSFEFDNYCGDRENKKENKIDLITKYYKEIINE